MSVKVKDYKDFIKAYNASKCPSVTGKKKAELKVLAESLGFTESDIKTTERKTAPKRAVIKAPKTAVVKAPKKAPVKKEPKEFKTKLQRMAERAEKKLERLRDERKKQESKIAPTKTIKVPQADKKELKVLVADVEKSLSVTPNKEQLKELLGEVEKSLSVPKRTPNPNPKADLKKLSDDELKKDLNIIIDNYIFDNDKKINKILEPIFSVPKYRAGDAIKEANEKFKKLNTELGKDYKNLFDGFKKYNTEMNNRKMNTQSYIKKINDYRKKNIEYIKRTLEI